MRLFIIRLESKSNMHSPEKLYYQGREDDGLQIWTEDIDNAKRFPGMGDARSILNDLKSVRNRTDYLKIMEVKI